MKMVCAWNNYSYFRKSITLHHYFRIRFYFQLRMSIRRRWPTTNAGWNTNEEKSSVLIFMMHISKTLKRKGTNFHIFPSTYDNFHFSLVTSWMIGRVVRFSIVSLREIFVFRILGGLFIKFVHIVTLFIFLVISFYSRVRLLKCCRSTFRELVTNRTFNEEYRKVI